ncbi:MAG: hypothetical protein Q8N36_00735 [bacterium]|nr:hypothetical protein [bacterium]
MSKTDIVGGIAGKLKVQGIPYLAGQGTDLAISAEFVIKSWGLGKKTITYEAAIMADERSHTVYMWDKTVEASRGLSFGMENNSSFQSGKTIYRKVTGVQYGLDGKAQEYSFDLGSIPEAVKKIAEQHNWKFMTTLTKSKAQY